jgi:hypothetical protein
MKAAAESNNTKTSSEQEKEYVSFAEGLARAKAKREAAEKFKSGYISFEEGVAMRARAKRAAAAKRRAEEKARKASEEIENEDEYESFADRCIRLGQAILVE